MKLFVLLSRFPYPLEKGDKLRAFHFIQELAKQHDIYLCCLSDQPVNEHQIQKIKPLTKELHVFQQSKAITYFNTAVQFFTDKPYQKGYFYQRGIQKKINELIQRIQPDHIFCQLIRTAEYVKDFHTIPKTIDYMDALARGMFRRGEIAKGLAKKMYLSEGKRLAVYENRIFDYFNHHVIISSQDKKCIQHPDAEKIHVIENGIGEQFLNYTCTQKKEFDLVFVGNLNYAPNIEGSETLVNEVLPELLKKNIRPSVLIAGATPHARVLSLQSDQVTVKSWTEDVRDYYCSGRIFVAPLFIGTGLQNKLLEAMALHLPCVTTPLVNNALGAKDSESILLAANPREFADCIARLISDTSLAQRIASNGKAYVTSTFSWAKAAEKLEGVFRS